MCGRFPFITGKTIHMRLFKELAFAAALSFAALYNLTAAHAHETRIGNITIDHAWSRQSPMAADVAAGFMTITNSGGEDDRLLKATATITGNVQLHDMKMTGDVMKMVELTEGIVIPAGATVELKPRSLHVMFLGLTAPPQEGDVIKGTLVFEKAGIAEIEYEVAAPTAGMGQ
jgi:periplasmic copper chaperone A